MAFASRYSRVNPTVASSDYQPHGPAQVMEFSNSIDTPTASKDVKHSYMERSNEHSPQSSTELPNYEPYGNQYGGERPGKPPRRGTGNSIVTTLSSVWSSTRDGISHFRIPKVAAPWEHEQASEKDAFSSQQPTSTTREFDHRKQRLRLFVNSSFRLLFTALLCAGLAAVLYGFSTIDGGMSQDQKRGFNALITGLSIIVGLNLSASLKGYASMMRWRFLAAGYRRLQDFELVMQCESQQAVFRLLWAGRTRGHIIPNKTQVLAFIWLTINVALQIVTALLGLTYSIDISERFVYLTHGNITIANVTGFGLSTSDDWSISSQGAVAQNYGVNGQDYGVDYSAAFGDYVGAQQTLYTNGDESFYWYSWIDQDPAGKETVLSTRQIKSTATCRDFKVLKGGYAGYDNLDAEFPNDVTIELDDGSNTTVYVDPQSTGGTTWSVTPSYDIAANSRCGPRCNIIYALQVADNYTVPNPRYWRCENTVSHVTNYAEYGPASEVDMPDEQAWIAAGAIGFSGSTTTFTDSGDDFGAQYMMYPAGTFWSPPGDVTAKIMAGKIMMFTVGAFAAMDMGIADLRVTIDPTTAQKPTPAQVVHVQWMWACVVLGVIPFTQGLVLLCVIAWANKAVIRDDGYLATAQLLAPIVNKLGDRGSVLTSDEIADELGNYRVVYGPRFPSGTARGQEHEVIKRLGVIAEDEGVDRWHGRMPGGKYD
jgi:hypothetical protein